MVLGKLSAPGSPTEKQLGRGLLRLQQVRVVVVWTFFSQFSPCLGDGPIKNEILSQMAVKPKTTNQPILKYCCRY